MLVLVQVWIKICRCYCLANDVILSFKAIRGQSFMQFSTDISAEIKHRIEAAMPDAQVEVNSGGDRHYTISILSSAFEGLSPVKQQQMVYAAINDMMAGNDAPIHAIDRMNLRVS
jgi:acid stress-induced BolA-like protein IbaG/YrbA